MAKKKQAQGPGRPKKTKPQKKRDGRRKAAAKKTLAGRAGRRGGDPIEGEPLAEPPAAPEDLASAHAAALWAELAGPLHKAGALCRLDLPAFRLLCEAWGQYRDLDDYADPANMFFETRTGYHAEHPGVRLRAQALARFQAMARTFGLTPLAREAISMAAESEGAAPVEAFGDAKPA